MLAIEITNELGSLDLDLTVEPGSCLALTGPSGAGKTTLLRVVAGLLRPDSGKVGCGSETWLDTSEGVDLPPESRRTGFVFQHYALFPRLSAWRNVAYALPHEPRDERRRHALELLERLGLAARAEALPAHLSGGERQRVALARALARRPHALLLDEPLSALDSRTRGAAARELHAVLHESEAPALLVTHDFEDAALLGDEVAVIDSGRLVQRGTAAELAGAPASAFVADLTGAVVVTGNATRGPDGLTLVQMDGGGELASTDPGEGRVAASVHPWEIALEPHGGERHGSARNRLAAEVVSVTTLGSRVRVGLMASQPLAAEITAGAARELGLAPGTRVLATWKAAATRVVAL